MCRAADAAMAMVNRSIELARKTRDESYYMDFVKLHKLLYLAQCEMLARYGRLLFEDRITAHQCGPYVEGIHFIPGECGFGQIRNPFDAIDFVKPSYRQMEVIDATLESYGTLRTEELIEYTRNTLPYCAVADKITESYRPQISRTLMSQMALQSVG